MFMEDYQSYSQRAQLMTNIVIKDLSAAAKQAPHFKYAASIPHASGVVFSLGLVVWQSCCTAEYVGAHPFRAPHFKYAASIPHASGVVFSLGLVVWQSCCTAEYVGAHPFRQQGGAVLVNRNKPLVGAERRGRANVHGGLPIVFAAGAADDKHCDQGLVGGG